jgi:hypothetical protein
LGENGNFHDFDLGGMIAVGSQQVFVLTLIFEQRPVPRFRAPLHLSQRSSPQKGIGQAVRIARKWITEGRMAIGFVQCTTRRVQ